MPVYSYRCANCGEELEHRLGFNDPHLIKCPVCGEETLKRVYKPVRVIFKGPGFYATDNHSPSGVKNGKPDDDGAKSASDESGKKEKSETKSEKPAAKTEKAKTT